MRHSKRYDEKVRLPRVWLNGIPYWYDNRASELRNVDSLQDVIALSSLENATLFLLDSNVDHEINFHS